MTAVLRVSGASVDIDECLTWLPKNRVESVWRIGTPDRKGVVRKASGFNLLLSEQENPERLVGDAVRVLLGMHDRIAGLVREGAIAAIDFALFVGPVAPASIRFEAEALEWVTQNGVGIVVSAYPAADDDD
jgi:hypothetical protein